MSKKLTKDEFIEKAIKKHGDKYDYSKVEYVNDRTKVIIICDKHGEFEQIPNTHYRSGCGQCGIKKRSESRKTGTERIIENFFKKFGTTRFDYSEVKYIKKKSPVKIRCIEHDHIFYQTPEKHLLSKNGGCTYCCSIGKKTDVEVIKKKLYKIFGGKYIYYDIDNIKSTTDKIELECTAHNYRFIMPLISHLRGSGCKKCGKNYSYNFTEIVEMFRKVHGDKYDYIESTYKGVGKKISVVCKKHSTFEINVYTHLYGYGCSTCGKCNVGEDRISKYLLDNNIDFIRQHSFPDCKNVNTLQFDFYIPHIKMCIEYDGKQHFEPIDFFGGIEAYEYCVKRDTIKNIYCEENGINLLRIPYYEYKNIDKILNKLTWH